MEISERNSAIVFSVRVQPRASRNAIEGEWQGALKVRLTAPPVDDKANAALCALLAEYLNIPRSAVRILAGERSRLKRVEIRGVTIQQIRELGAAPGEQKSEKRK
ncbi:MAG: DUF167 domain-containing protein [Acidobacteria bacterium]|nr:DUF167 domain-containing protein [Acidobacteriota bacterium]MBI3662848.1 DUF167 domain-containing protein [Acidobacteriota bacterium]